MNGEPDRVLRRSEAVTLPELRYLARVAGDVPLPSGDVEVGEDDLAYLEIVERLAEPAASLARRGLLTDGDVEPELVVAVRLLAGARVGVDLDIAVDGTRSLTWHRRTADVVATLSTTDGVAFRLGWFATTDWADELARAGTLAETVPLAPSRVPGYVDLPHALAEAGVAAVRSGRPHLLRGLAAEHRGLVTDADGRALADVDVAEVLAGLTGEPHGQVRVCVTDRHPAEGTGSVTVGVVVWVLVADGWRSLRPHLVDGRVHLEVRRVLPEHLAGDLAPILAAVGDRR